VAAYEEHRSRQVAQQRQQQQQQPSSQQASGEPLFDEKDVFDAIMGLAIEIDGYDPEVHDPILRSF